jgi:hypothetical protein
MSEYELGEILYNSYGSLWEGSQMYFTLVSAYLVVSYLVGHQLTRVQNIIITSLYLVWIIGIVDAQRTESIINLGLINELQHRDSIVMPAQIATAADFGLYSFIAVQIAGVLASLYFMWTVRHPKTK